MKIIITTKAFNFQAKTIKEKIIKAIEKQVIFNINDYQISLQDEGGSLSHATHVVAESNSFNSTEDMTKDLLDILANNLK